MSALMSGASAATPDLTGGAGDVSGTAGSLASGGLGSSGIGGLDFNPGDVSGGGFGGDTSGFGPFAPTGMDPMSAMMMGYSTPDMQGAALDPNALPGQSAMDQTNQPNYQTGQGVYDQASPQDYGEAVGQTFNPDAAAQASGQPPLGPSATPPPSGDVWTSGGQPVSQTGSPFMPRNFPGAADPNAQGYAAQVPPMEGGANAGPVPYYAASAYGAVPGSTPLPPGTPQNYTGPQPAETFAGSGTFGDANQGPGIPPATQLASTGPFTPLPDSPPPGLVTDVQGADTTAANAPANTQGDVTAGDVQNPSSDYNRSVNPSNVERTGATFTASDGKSYTNLGGGQVRDNATGNIINIPQHVPGPGGATAPPGVGGGQGPGQGGGQGGGRGGMGAISSILQRAGVPGPIANLIGQLLGALFPQGGPPQNFGTAPPGAPEDMPNYNPGTFPGPMTGGQFARQSAAQPPFPWSQENPTVRGNLLNEPTREAYAPGTGGANLAPWAGSSAPTTDQAADNTFWNNPPQYNANEIADEIRRGGEPLTQRPGGGGGIVSRGYSQNWVNPRPYQRGPLARGGRAPPLQGYNDNWAKFAYATAYAESGANPRSNPSVDSPSFIRQFGGTSHPRGAFQFEPATRAQWIRAGVGDPWAGDYQQQAQTFARGIQHFYPRAAQAIQNGDFDTAFRYLNRTWTSMPGGIQAQSGLFYRLLGHPNAVAYGY